MTGRLDGSLEGVPLTIEADGSTIRMRVSKLFGAIGALRRTERAIAPLRPSLKSSGVRIRIKLGMLPEFTVG